MRPLHIIAGVTVAGALAAAVLLSQSGANGEPALNPSATDHTVVRKSQLVDVHGAFIEEFSGGCEGSRYPYFCRQVTNELRGHDERLLTRDGLTIRTTFDPKAQRASQRAIDAYVGRADTQVATQVMIVPGSGEIRAMATSRGFGEGEGLSQGPIAMVYPLAAALEGGMRYDDGFASADEYRAVRYSSFKNCAGDLVGDPSHAVLNAKRGGAEFVTLRSGTRETVNTFVLKLVEKVGLCETVRMAERLGLHRADGAPLGEHETFALGVNEVEPVSVANSYATFAARGRYCAPMAITAVHDDSGTVRSFAPACRQVLDPAVADAVTGVLATEGEGGVGRAAAGMAGTAGGAIAAWYAGYTPALASAVSLGDMRGGYRYPLTDVTIGGRHYPSVSGTSIPGPIWTASMAEAVRETAPTAFVAPDTARFGGCRDACQN
jgi:membrane peptidoglycan carboxypeptidase